MNFESIKRMTSSYNTNTTKATGDKVLSHYSCCRLFLRHEFSSSVGECKRILEITLIREWQFFLPNHKKRINFPSFLFFSFFSFITLFSFIKHIIFIMKNEVYRVSPFHLNKVEKSTYGEMENSRKQTILSFKIYLLIELVVIAQ